MNTEMSIIRLLGAAQLIVFVASMVSERLLASVGGITCFIVQGLFPGLWRPGAWPRSVCSQSLSCWCSIVVVPLP